MDYNFIKLDCSINVKCNTFLEFAMQVVELNCADCRERLEKEGDLVCIGFCSYCYYIDTVHFFYDHLYSDFLDLC